MTISDIHVGYQPVMSKKVTSNFVITDSAREGSCMIYRVDGHYPVLFSVRIGDEGLTPIDDMIVIGVDVI